MSGPNYTPPVPEADPPEEAPDGTEPTPTPTESTNARKSKEKQLRSANYRRQCYLINYWQSILKETKHWKRGLGGYAPFELEDYEMISCINSQPATLMNQIHGGPGLDDFFDLTNTQQSALVPQVRLWKVWFSNGMPDPLRAPQEFIFDNAISSQDISAIGKSGRGRASGIGLVEVNIDDQSTLIGETNKRFYVEFKFRFQSMEDIIKVVNGEAHKDDQISFTDLVTPGIRPGSTGETDECEPEVNPGYETHIKASFGWGIPKSMSGGGTDVLFGNRKKQIMRALKAARKTYFLNLIDHTFDFKQDGTIELVSSYQAYTEAAYASNQFSDLLFPAMNNKEREALFKKRKELIDKLERRKKLPVDAETAAASEASYAPSWKDKLFGGVGGGSSGGNFESNFETTLKNEQSTIERKLRLDKAMRYNRIIRNLYRRNLPTYSLWVTKEKIYDTFSPETATGDVRITSADLSPSLLRTAGFIEKSLENADSDTDARDEVKKRITDQNTIDTQKKRSKSTDWVEINFTFLGSLIDAICVMLRDGNDGLFDTRFLMGPAVVYMGAPNYPQNRVAKIVNLADIPVSIKAFENFWLEKVVKRMRDTYKLSEFLRDMINEFLLQILDSECLDRDDIEDKMKAGCKDTKGNPIPRKAVAMEYFSLNRISNDPEDPGKPPIPDGKKLLLTPENFKEMFQLSEYQSQFNVMHYALVYLNNPTLKGFKGDIEEDQSQGVYHLYIGRDRGIVKSMTFKKIDDPMLKASQLVKNIDEGATMPIPEPYDVTVETFGNALFKPGQKVYVIPSFLFKAGSTAGTTLAKKLLIGGYYNILKVNSTISPESFTTTLEARWESSGLRKEDQEVEIQNAYPYFDIIREMTPELAEQLEEAAEESVEDVADPNSQLEEELGIQDEPDDDFEEEEVLEIEGSPLVLGDTPLEEILIEPETPETNSNAPSRGLTAEELLSLDEDTSFAVPEGSSPL
jgi:hypothetical protein